MGKQKLSREDEEDHPRLRVRKRLLRGLPLLMVTLQMGLKKAEVDQRKQKKKQLLKRLVVKVGVDQRKQQNRRKRNLQRRQKMVMMLKRQQGKVKRDLNKHLEGT